MIINARTIKILAIRRSQNKCLKNRKSMLYTTMNMITIENKYLIAGCIF